MTAQKSIKYYASAGCIILLLIAMIAAYLRYTHHQQQRAASHYYETLLTSLINQTHGSDITPQAIALTQLYPHTIYANLAQLQLARQAVYKNNLPEAQQWLMKVIETCHDPDLQAIARQRAARIHLALRQPEQALKLLDKKACAGYTAACSEIEGDILAASGRKSEALKAYQTAQRALPELETLQPLLQMKLEDLGRLQEEV